jgi:hypothetical protein
MKFLKYSLLGVLFLIAGCSERDWFEDWFPENFRATASTDDVILQWDSPSENIDYFVIDRQIYGLDWDTNFSGEISSSTVQYQDDDVEPAQSITYRLYAVKDDMKSQYVEIEANTLQYPGM